MLRKSADALQIDMFSSPSTLFSGKVQSNYEDEVAWHNVFRNKVTMRIDEGVFSPLYSSQSGRPNASIRVLVGMMILKEAEGLSDQKIFENCRYNMLYRSSLGLVNINDALPTESTYYLFRKKIVEYEKEKKVNLFSKVFEQITKEQCSEFEVSGQRVRMDSKLLSSNIKWMSRYELIHKTLDIHYRVIKNSPQLDETTKAKLTEALKLEGEKVVYTQTSKEVKTRLVELGALISKVLELTSYCELESYKTLYRVFTEQYTVGEDKIVVAKQKEEITAQSVQSPHDTDCTYRNKGGNDGQKKQQVKGYSANITETCDDDKLNLITQVNVQPANTSDVDFLQTDIKKTQEIIGDKIKRIHADGAYHSTENQDFCTENEIELYVHAIQGSKGRYEFEMSEDENLIIYDTQTQQIIENTQVTSKDGSIKWRIKTGNTYRYITKKAVDTYQLRKKIEQVPKEEYQRRNNVEATIFQLGYHYRNAKSKYRGLARHQMWANMRSLWVNFVRILKFIVEKGLNSVKTVKEFLIYCTLVQLMTHISKYTRPIKENLSFNSNCRHYYEI